MRSKGGDLKMKLRKDVIITFYVDPKKYEELQELRNSKYCDLTRPAFYRMLIDKGLVQLKKENF